MVAMVFIGSIPTWVAAALQARTLGEETRVAAEMPPDEKDLHDGEPRENEDAEPGVVVLGEIRRQGEGGHVQGEGGDLDRDLDHVDTLKRLPRPLR
jgi:hypothetical protein